MFSQYLRCSLQWSISLWQEDRIGGKAHVLTSPGCLGDLALERDNTWCEEQQDRS